MEKDKLNDPSAETQPEELTAGSDRFPDHHYEYQPDALAGSQQGDAHLLVSCRNGLKMKIEAVTDEILRFRYAPTGGFGRDFSYALAPNPSVMTPASLSFSESADQVQLSTAALTCTIWKTDLRTRITDRKSGEVLSEDAAPFLARYSVLRGMEEVRIQKTAAPGEAFFGLGDKTCTLNLRGQKLQNWNTDAYAFTRQTDPLYRAIPFYYGLRNGQAYGIFFHNAHRTHFDFAQTEEEMTTFAAEGGEMDYFFIHGPGLVEVARRFHALTGRPELPPRWVTGFHQCRWSYYPDSRVREVAAEFRKRRIPCDALYLDIDYMDGYRCFTWNKDLFPDPAGLIADLKKDGFRTVVMIDPGIRADDDDYHVYRDGLEKGMFCRRSTGELMRGPVWPSECVFPDYTRPEVRKWWGPLYRELYEKNGVSGFWNDMNEPAIFQIRSKTFPDDILHDCDGEQGGHRRAHNVYGQQMSRATYDGLKAIKPHQRPFVLTRASFSGGQRYAAVWTGDNIASWEHLRLANRQCQRLSLSGFSLVGSDIGGFVLQPTGELLVRWLQLGVFHPVFRIHSMGNNVDGGAEVDAEAVLRGETENRMDQEPWSFGEENARLARIAIEYRYQLIPYIYTTLRQHSLHGEPVIQSLSFEDQSDPETLHHEREFVFGDHLLVSPVERAEAEYQNIYLPAGAWYDYWTGKAWEGKRTHRLALRPDRIPVFARAGAVIPTFPVMQYTGEKKVEELGLRVYHGAAQSHLYEDAGDGYDYQQGDYAWFTYQTRTEAKKLTLTQEQKGKLQPDWKRCRLTLLGLPAPPRTATVDGEKVEVFSTGKGIWEVEVPAGFESVELSW